jgi:hypothetical protein
VSPNTAIPSPPTPTPNAPIDSGVEIATPVEICGEDELPLFPLQIPSNEVGSPGHESDEHGGTTESSTSTVNDDVVEEVLSPDVRRNPPTAADVTRSICFPFQLFSES